MRLALVTVLALALADAAGAPRVVAAHGVRVTVGAGWERVRPAPAGAVTDPATLLVVGTTGVRARPSQCQVAAYRIPAAGAVVVVLAWKHAAAARPTGRGPLARLTAVHRPIFECFEGRGAAASLVLGRTPFQVNVLVGDRASAARVAAALAVARSFARTR